MQYNFIKEYLHDPRMIVAAVGIVALIILLIVLFVLRAMRRRRGGEDDLEAELVAREHEEQFIAAVEHLPFSIDPAEVGRAIGSVFQQYLGVNVAAIYGGRGEAGAFRNVLGGNGGGWVESVAFEFVRRYSRPQLASSAVFRPGGRGTGALPSMPIGSAYPPNEGESLGSAAAPAAVSPAPATSASALPSTAGASDSFGFGAGPAAGGRSVAVLPWQGPFGWKGLILCEAPGPIDMDAIARVYQPQGSVAGHLAIALELGKKQSRLESSDEQAARLAEFIGVVLKNEPAQTGLPGVLQAITRFLGGDSSAYWRLDAQSRTLRMVAANGFDPEEFLPVPLGQGFSGRVAESGEPLFAEDAPSDPRCLFPGQCRDAGICSYIGVPVTADGSEIGVLEVYTREPKSWELSNVFSLQAAGAVLGAVVSGSFGKDQTAGDTWLKAESAYMKLSEAVHGLQSRDEVLESAVEVLGHALGASRVVAIELDERMASRAYGVKYEYLAPDVTAASGLAFSEEFAVGVFGAAKEGGPIVLTKSEEKSLMSPAMVSRLHVLSEIAIPINLNGEVRALLYVHQCDHVREWAREEIEFAGRIGHQVSLALASLRLIEKAAKESEMARVEAQRAAEVGVRARGLIDALPEPVIGLDKEGRLTFFNGAGRHRLKLRNEDLGRMADMTEALTVENETLWQQVNQCESIARFETRIAPPRVTAQLAAPDRTLAAGGRLQNAGTVPISIAVAPIRDEKGAITGRIAVLTDLSHLEAGSSKEPAPPVAELEKKVRDLEASLAEANRVLASMADSEAAESATEKAAGTPAQPEPAERQVQGEVEVGQVRDDEARARRAAQQLLEINRLKSDFIVNAGRELDASLQSVLGFAELLGQGSYGSLSPEQLEAVKGIYAWARRMKSDVDWLVEYGSTRSRRLEDAAGVQDQPKEEGAG